jgi:hypothetical protein
MLSIVAGTGTPFFDPLPATFLSEQKMYWLHHEKSNMWLDDLSQYEIANAAAPLQHIQVCCTCSPHIDRGGVHHNVFKEILVILDPF